MMVYQRDCYISSSLNLVIMVSYLSAVIPTIVAVWILSLVERVLTRVIPETVRNFAVPMLAVAIVVPVTFLAVGPASYYLGEALSNGVNWLWELSPALGGFILGGTWSCWSSSACTGVSCR